MTRLDDTALARYERDGFLTPLGALDRAEADGKFAALEEIEAAKGGRFPHILNAKAHLVVPFLWDLVQDPRILDTVEQILGPDLLCWGSSFFAKVPGSNECVPMHQDGTYWGLSRPAALTVWLAFTHSGEDNGCMRVLPGSHKAPLRHTVTNQPGSMLPIGEEVNVDVDEADLVSCILEPGEMSIHHVLTVHGSEPNPSPDKRRVGFAIRYVDGRVPQREGANGSATLVRGKDHGTFALEQAPEGLFAPEALRRQQSILRGFSRTVLTEAAKHEQST